ncbi:hypothetical protein NP493_152g02002 [Ridgeia piscesae]|uniref:NR LBD domain-containing protein n=1 Tax=Ridgeia piscesae TaxID=27915 RepID=A0AAD9P497_RIDPI|nr:hypothetical protein NP493_152g02002 [Ridgeia piscesae]
MYLKETNEMSAAARVPVHFRSPFFGGIMGMNEGITHCAAEPAKLPLGVLCQPTPKYPHELSQAYFSNPEAICEAAARILFMSVKWAKCVPAFLSLPIRDQVLLLEEGWRELFVLGAAQFQMPIEATPLLAAAGLSVDKSPPEKVMAMMTEIGALQEIIAKFKAMRVDPTEYACLKGIVMFKTALPNATGDVKTLRDVQMAASLQDQAQLTLNKYIMSAYPTQPFRFGKLLLMLPSLKTISSNTIEELFFRKTIGSIPIERLLIDMFKSTDF